jgi:hypothetical protein
MMTNQEFIERHAKPGAVGLVGGPLLIDQMVRRAQKRQTADGENSPFSHAFVFSGKRQDGHYWVIESDIDLHSTHARIGVQENRVAKYFDRKDYDALAILDFGIEPAAAEKVIGLGLELVASRAQYSLREIMALYVSLKRPARRAGKSNALSQDRALFCSALVQQLYLAIGIDFHPDIDTKLTTPEDIFQTKIPHARHLMAT